MSWEHDIIYNYFKDQGLSDSECKYMVNKISNAIRQTGDIVCCDNFRFSINGNNDKSYEQIRSNGCCGFYDDIILLNNGTKVKFGFNYGH